MAKDLNNINSKAHSSYCYLDLGDKQSIKDFAEYVIQNSYKVDFLINNAGVMMIPERRETKDGL